jgi:hypothetical protein
MRRGLTVLAMAIGTGLGLLAIGLAMGPSETAIAQTPTLIAAPIGGGFSGVPPRAGGTGLLITTEDSSAGGLANTLRDAGCETLTLSATDAGLWSSYVAGAPDFVNAPFPVLLRADTPFSVRCDSVTPIVNPPGAVYGLDGGDVTLTDGASAAPVAPGSAIQILTNLSIRQSYAYLDGDAIADAAVVVTQQPGGSGTFSYLSVVPSAALGPAPVVLLGDRITVDRVAAAHGQVTVTYLDRPFGVPFAAAPTVPVTRHFKLEGGALVELGTGTCEATNLDDIGSFVFVTNPAIGAQVFSGFTVEGCSRTFESTVNWRLLGRDGGELASGFTMGGGVDGADRFSFIVAYAGVTGPEVGNLEVFEVDASGGAGPPPPKAVIPLVLP